MPKRTHHGPIPSHYEYLSCASKRLVDPLTVRCPFCLTGVGMDISQVLNSETRRGPSRSYDVPCRRCGELIATAKVSVVKEATWKKSAQFGGKIILNPEAPWLKLSPQHMAWLKPTLKYVEAPEALVAALQ